MIIFVTDFVCDSTVKLLSMNFVDDSVILQHPKAERTCLPAFADGSASNLRILIGPIDLTCCYLIT